MEQAPDRRRIIDFRRVVISSIVLFLVIYITAQFASFTVRWQNCNLISEAVEQQPNELLEGVRDQICVFGKFASLWDGNRSVKRSIENESL
jgi:hypothetical protein